MDSTAMEPDPRRPMPAPFALPLGCAALLVVGAFAAGVHGRLSGVAVAVLCGVVVGSVSFVGEAATALPLALVGWMTATAFAHEPFGQLEPTSHQAVLAAYVVAASAALGIAGGTMRRATTTTTNGVPSPGESASARDTLPTRRTLSSRSRMPSRGTMNGVTGLSGFASAVNRRRRAYGLVLAAVLLPVLTVLLAAARADLSLADDLLIYIVAVVAVSLVGGFWPAIVATVAASLLLNWFFTEPVHTFTIAEPENLLALLLFIVVAISVSSVVHVAARRAQQAALSQAESENLLQLARTVLGHDTPAAVLEHLHTTLGLEAELLERSGDHWVRIAGQGDPSRPVSSRIPVRDDLTLVVRGASDAETARLLEAAAGQAAAALDRDRLRTQASQAEALAAGNRMRTALLAAVSHDLRTPLASIKASISSLRQTDVTWSRDDEAELLETIEDSTDRLDGLIANLLDMSRLQTGALQPYLQPAAVDEVAPLALRGLAGARTVLLDVPEDVPLVLTDPGLLERALANLLSNALRYSPPGRPPELVARVHGQRVEVRVVDHGPGVRPGDRERIFEPFQRLGDQAPSTGVGLGLAVARGFVESVGGSLVAADTPAGGLTMVASLPAASSRVAARGTVDR